MPRSVAAHIEDEEELFRTEVETAPVREKTRGRPVAAPAPATTVTRSVEERLAAIEATTGLAEVKSSLTKWVLFSAAGVLVGVLGLVFTLHGSTNARIDSMASELRAEIRATNDKMDTKFDQVNQRIEQLQSETNARFDQVNARIDQTNQRLDKMQSETNQRLDRVIEMLAQQAARSARD